MQFNVAQSEDVTTGAEYGMIGSAATGRVRGPVAKDTQKLGKRAALKLAKSQRSAHNSGSLTAVGGFATSLALGSKQGLEFVDPNAARDRLKDGTATTYFSEATGFFSSKKR